MTAELILVRHGETVWNAQDRFQGQQDSPLTATGQAHAQAVAAHLAAYAPHAIYASDLGRTLATAQPLADAIGLPILPEPALRERNLGVLEGLTRAEAEAQIPDVVTRYFGREVDYEVPNGESLRHLHNRALAALEVIAQRHAGQRVAVISHGALLSTVLRHMLGIPQTRIAPFTIRNGSLTWVRYNGQPDSWLVLSLGEVAHLRAVAVAPVY
jgi:probable phosphoglycerate mutase